MSRRLQFYAVGAIGIGVQLSVLAALVRGAGVDYRLATALAVESALLHNFLWHDRWTWADRASTQPSLPGSLVRYHLSVGVVSIGGNLLLTSLFVALAHLNVVLANGAAIALCSLANFIACDRIVFTARSTPEANRAGLRSR